LENISERKFGTQINELDMFMHSFDVSRFMDFVDKTNKFSGIILKKAEMDHNFNKVYSHAVKKIVELQFFNYDEIPTHDNFLEMFGEIGG